MSERPIRPVPRSTRGLALRRFLRRWLSAFFGTLLTGWLVVVIAAPIFVRNKIQMTADPVARIIAPEEVPEAARDSLRRILTSLARAGFEEDAWLRMEPLADAVNFVAVSRHTEGGTLGSGLAIYQRTPSGLEPQGIYIELATELDDGLRVLTDTSTSPRAFRPRADRLQATYPDVEDAAELYALHRQRVRDLGTAAQGVLPPAGELVAYAVGDFIDTYEGQVKTGFLYLDVENRTYRMTWEGAILMTWKQIWPLSHLL